MSDFEREMHQRLCYVESKLKHTVPSYKYLVGCIVGCFVLSVVYGHLLFH